MQIMECCSMCIFSLWAVFNRVLDYVFIIDFCVYESVCV